MTELDFGIISKLKGFKEDLKINWQWLITTLNADDDNKELQALKQYIEIIENKGYYYKQIRLNDYSRIFIEQNETHETLADIKLKSLKYLTVYTITMIKYLTLNYHYHESIYEFSNISDTGIFETKKMQGYKIFFDEDSYFPFQ